MQTGRIQLLDDATRIASFWLFLSFFCLLASTAKAAPPPVITAQPLDQNVALGGTAIFTVTATSGTALSYQWYKDGLLNLDTKLAGETASTLTIKSVGLLDPGTYYVEVMNAGGTVESRHASLTAALLNTAPVANNDTYTTAEDTPRNVPVPGVLANDTDADGNTLTAVLVSNVTHGSLNLNANGSFSYVPNPDYNGSDSFTYAANDGSVNGNIATVIINITPVNDTPVANNDTYTTPEDVTLSVPASGVLANDTDADGQSLVAVLVSNVTQGSLSLGTNGSFTYVPPSNYFGSVSFTYGAADGFPVLLEQNASGGDRRQISTGSKSSQSFMHGTAGGSSYMISKVVLSLSRRSGGSGNLNFGIGAGVNAGEITRSSRSISASSITNTSDGNSFQTYAIVYDVPIGPFAAGTTYYLNLDNQASERFYVEYPNNNTYANGTYYEDGGDQGKDMRFQIYETVLSNPATVTINITPVNDAPVANDDSYKTSEGMTLTVPASGVLSTGNPGAGILANDTDVEGDVLTALLVGNVSHGSLALNANGSFTYMPDAGYVGTDSFTYRASDGSATGNVATVTITVVPISRPPTITAQRMTLAGFELQVSGIDSAACVIWASTNLQDWMPISTNTPTAKAFVFTDTEARNYSSRFYRAESR